MKKLVRIVEEMSPVEAQAKKDAIALAQEKKEDAIKKLETAKSPLEKKAAQSALAVAKEDDLQAKATQENISEETRKYTTQESTAVGKAVAKSLVKVLKAQGDEVVNIKLTGLGVDKFNIHVKYGNDKGADTFKFNLNPEGTAIILDLGNEPLELVDFVITQGNTVSLPTPELEDKLSDAMKKYVGEPTDAEYDNMAAMQAPTDPSQLNKNIPEGVDTQSEFDVIRGGRIIATNVKFLPNGRDYRVGSKFDTLGPIDSTQLSAHTKGATDLINHVKASGGLKEDDHLQPDDETSMAKAQLRSIQSNASKMMDLLGDDDQLDAWVQSKLTKAEDYLDAVAGYTESEKHQDRSTRIIALALNEISFKINGLGNYTSIKGDNETITGRDQGGTVRTFTRKKVEQDNPGIFDKQPRERKPKEEKPQGVRPYSEAQYRKILQGAIDDAGSTEFAHDIADSMIYDPQILARLAKDYPRTSATELRQRLQWDLEACDSSEDNYDDDYEGEVVEAVLNEKKATHCGRCGHTHVKGTPCPRPFKNEALDAVGKEDDDVNNDEKVDKTDKYLKNRRDTVSKKISKSELKEIMLEAYIEVLKEQENAVLETSTDEILGKFPTVKKAITSLFTKEYPEFVTDVRWVVPKPSTFAVDLKNGQSFNLKWMGKGFEAQIEGKKYYLDKLAEYQQALDKINDLLKNGPITTGEEPGGEEFGAPAAEPAAGGGGGGAEPAAEFGAEEAPAGDEGGAEPETPEAL